MQSSYYSGIEHWAESSTQISACSVEPGSAEDVGLIVRARKLFHILILHLRMPPTSFKLLPRITRPSQYVLFHFTWEHLLNFSDLLLARVKVKGGGHTANPGFSSTEGVHITMTRFNDVVYNADAGTADVGTGLIWDDVYEALAAYNVNVVGGRVPGVGVAGFTLGGGVLDRH